jgi:hypothetical protein
VSLEDDLHLLSPENVGFVESVTKLSGFVVETLPWFLEAYSQTRIISKEISELRRAPT